MILANASPELAAVCVVIVVLLIASLIAMAPLRKIRLPFTVAVMLTGFGLGALLNSMHGEGHPGPFSELLHMVGSAGGLSPSLILFVLLPPLVFESAFNMDVRELIKNLVPVTVLAVPVLILSTVITGAAVMVAGGEAHGLGWAAALLFGALISATDPVAVVALFKDLGAPKRLGVLVEGESLCNDGTAIVLFNILLAVIVEGASGSAGSMILGGVGKFLVVSLGGLAVGILLAWAAYALIGRVISDEQVEISLSVVLAYASFVVAEHFLHVSGVMATVAAGLVAGSYGTTKVSPSVSHFMHSFWEYMSFAMNSLIFFFVGLVIARQLSWVEVESRLGLLAATVTMVIVARAVGVFGSVPFLRRVVETIDLRYQTVMWWGGLRGAVSLALALTVFTHHDLPEATRSTILVLAAGMVLFTLLVNALTMQPLIVSMGLDRPSPVDRFALAFAERERVEVASGVIDRLAHEGAVLPSVLDAQRDRLEERLGAACAALDELNAEIADDPQLSEAVAARVALSVEKQEVMRRFSSGELTEQATRNLLASADALLDRIKVGLPLPEVRTVQVGAGRIESRLLSLLEPLPLLGSFARGIRARRLEADVEATRGLYLVARAVTRKLAEIEKHRGIAPTALGLLQARYSTWMFKAQGRLQQLTGEFPEYARTSQALLASLQTLRAESDALHDLAEAGLMTDKARAAVYEELHTREAALRAEQHAGIELDPTALLRSVPAFAGADDAVVAALASRLVSRTFLEGEDVVKEGEPGASMFLIARGAVGVSTTTEQGEEVPLSTLDAGGFFGEIAALLGGTRTATVRAVTPVNLLELRQSSLEEVLAEHPKLAEDVRASIYPRAVGRSLVDCPTLGSLTAEQRTDLAQRFSEQRFGAGASIAAADAPQQLGYVCEGTVRIGEREVGEGHVFGQGSFAGAPFGAEVVAADGAVRLLMLAPEELESFRKRFPASADACTAAAASVA